MVVRFLQKYMKAIAAFLGAGAAVLVADGFLGAEQATGLVDAIVNALVVGVGAFGATALSPKNQE